MNPFEVAGFIFGVIGVFLTIKVLVWCFPVGLINVTLSLVLFWQQKLYSDAFQQLVYMVLLSYGWWSWSQKKDDAPLPVTRMNVSMLVLSISISIAVAAIAGFLLHRFTDASMPYADAIATSLSFLAQFLVAKKKIENWWIWIIVNIIYIGIYINKGLHFYALLFAIYLALAVYGLNTWKKQMTTLNRPTA